MFKLFFTLALLGVFLLVTFSFTSSGVDLFFSNRFFQSFRKETDFFALKCKCGLVPSLTKFGNGCKVNFFADFLGVTTILLGEQGKFDNFLTWVNFCGVVCSEAKGLRKRRFLASGDRISRSRFSGEFWSFCKIFGWSGNFAGNWSGIDSAWPVISSGFKWGWRRHRRCFMFSLSSQVTSLRSVWDQATQVTFSSSLKLKSHI